MGGRQPIKYWETEVDPARSASELTGLLVRYGATQTSLDWDRGRLVGLSFTLPHDRLGSFRIHLRARTDLVLRLLRERNVRGDLAQLQARAERIVWRHMKDLTEQQLVAAELGQFDVVELFLAQMEIVTPNGASSFGEWIIEALEAGQIPRDGAVLMLPPAGGTHREG